MGFIADMQIWLVGLRRRSHRLALIVVEQDPAGRDAVAVLRYLVGQDSSLGIVEVVELSGKIDDKVLDLVAWASDETGCDRFRIFVLTSAMLRQVWRTAQSDFRVRRLMEFVEAIP